MSKVTHPVMVKALAKPGEDIAATLSAEAADLWHAATGVAGETAEILEAVAVVSKTVPLDRENMIEELGDMEFYIEQARRNVGLSRDDTMPGFTMSGATPMVDAVMLSIAGGQFLDLVKKSVLYQKPIPKTDFITRLRAIEEAMAALRLATNISYEMTIAGNIYKLAEGPNARYKDGYSDQAAQDRADKAEGE